MNTNVFVSFFLFWGIWLSVPLLIDGIAVVTQILGVSFAQWRKRRNNYLDFDLKSYPTVSLVLPVFNGAQSLAKTIRSIRVQTYPLKQLEVIVIENGSTDTTVRAFLEQQWLNSLGSLQWISIPSTGKAPALNAGIHMAVGEYISNVDCDIELHPDAVLNMVKAFEADPRLAAATGAVEIARRESNSMSPVRYPARECEFVEYLAAFRIGRQMQSMANSLFTLAGAFSFFRRSVLLSLPQYSNRTVSEDTNITFSLRQRFPDAKVACIAEATAYVEPSGSFAALYSQRVRWQRGELEVAACNPRLLNRNFLRFTGTSPVRTLIVDHTLAFPRVVWTFLLPMMFLFGYGLPLVVSATLVMYVCYMALEAATLATCYLLVDGETRNRLRKHWWIFTVLPAYRFFLFWNRLGGFLTVMNERPQWQVRAPWREAADHGGRLASKTAAITSELSASVLARPLSLLLGMFRTP